MQVVYDGLYVMEQHERRLCFRRKFLLLVETLSYYQYTLKNECFEFDGGGEGGR